MELSGLIAYLSAYTELSVGFKQALREDGGVDRKRFRDRHFLLDFHKVPLFTYFLESGFATGYCLLQGQRVAARFVAPQQGITPDGFFSRRPSAESIVLSPGSSILRLGRDYVAHLFERFPEAGRLARMVQEAYHRESEQEKQILRNLSAESKYRYLVRFRPEVLRHVSGKDIACYLGISPKTYYRIRKNR